MLAGPTFGVADNSQHLYGRALDVRLDSRVEEAMQAARAMQRGGGGWDPHSGVIHLDSGPVRHWTPDRVGVDQVLSRLPQLIAHSRQAVPPNRLARRAPPPPDGAGGAAREKARKCASTRVHRVWTPKSSGPVSQLPVR